MSATPHSRTRGWCPGEVQERLPFSPEHRSAPASSAPAASAPPAAPLRSGRVWTAWTRAAGRPHIQRPRWWAQLLVIAWLCWIYDLITDLAPVRQHAAVIHGFGLLHLERVLHVDPELALNRWLGAHHTLAVLLSDYYDNAHFAVTLGLLVWLWWRRPDLYRPLRNGLVLINAIGFAVFWRFPVAPPRLLSGSGFTDIVANSHAFGSFHSGSLASDANQLAAMPSLHMAWAAWSGLAMWRLWRGRAGATLALGYPLFTALVVMATGNHYLADVIAGVLTMGVAIAIVQTLGRRRSRAPSRAGASPLGQVALARLPRLSRRPTTASGASSPVPSSAK